MDLIPVAINDYGVPDGQKPIFWDKVNIVVVEISKIMKDKNK